MGFRDGEIDVESAQMQTFSADHVNIHNELRKKGGGVEGLRREEGM